MLLIGFIIVPTDLTVAEGTAAVFCCQHSSADAIGWGISLLDLSLEGVSAHSTSVAGGILNTLTIVAHPQYNLTQVKCVAVQFDGSPILDTEDVIMSIQGIVSHL